MVSYIHKYANNTTSTSSGVAILVQLNCICNYYPLVTCSLLFTPELSHSAVQQVCQEGKG